MNGRLLILNENEEIDEGCFCELDDRVLCKKVIDFVKCVGCVLFYVYVYFS